MILVKPYFRILNLSGGLGIIEEAGRTCYKSEGKIDPDSARDFVLGILRRGHESVIEHSLVTVRIICDRGVTHEIVRHRLASYSQESTRYCDYSGGVTFVIPPWVKIEPGEYKITWKGIRGNDIDPAPYKSMEDSWWFWSMALAERNYRKLMLLGWTPQQSRSVLPDSLKTEIVMSCNFREWRHFFKLRTSKAAHPQMREIAVPMLKEFQRIIPVIFEDINKEDKEE